MSATILIYGCRLHGYESAMTARDTAHLADMLVVERSGQDGARGHTGQFAPVRLPGAWPHASKHRVRIAAADADRLVAARAGAHLVRAA